MKGTFTFLSIILNLQNGRGFEHYGEEEELNSLLLLTVGFSFFLCQSLKPITQEGLTNWCTVLFLTSPSCWAQDQPFSSFSAGTLFAHEAHSVL